MNITNIRKHRSSFLLFGILALLPAVTGCQTNSDADRLRADVAVLQGNLTRYQNQVTVLQTTITQKDAQIEDMSKNPDSTPWWKNFIDWLKNTVGGWIVGKLLELAGIWIRSFTG